MISVTNVKVYVVRQFRFPRSKGKRIRKKYQKNKNNFRETELKSIKVFPETGMIELPKDHPYQTLTIRYSYVVNE